MVVVPSAAGRAFRRGGGGGGHPFDPMVLVLAMAGDTVQTVAMRMRAESVSRKTKETEVSLTLTVDGDGSCAVATGLPFFDHMLDLFCRHGQFTLEGSVRGDLDVDSHHTVEDTGIVLGGLLAGALGDKAGIRRMGCAYVPMDETLTRCVIDLSGRPFLVFRAPSGVAPVEPRFPFQLVEEFTRAFAMNAAANVHVEILYGKDAHHMAESVFKALARACRGACEPDPRATGIPSTKGTLV